jgi:hypothetical protein
MMTRTSRSIVIERLFSRRAMFFYVQHWPHSSPNTNEACRSISVVPWHRWLKPIRENNE